MHRTSNYFGLVVCFQVLYVALIKGQQQDMNAIFNSCKAEAGATEEDINTFKNSQIPSTVSGKCMLACMFNSSGLMTEGRYNVEGAHQLTSQVYSNNEDKKNKAKQVIDRCSKEVENESDKCEIAAKIAQCTMQVSFEDTPTNLIHCYDPPYYFVCIGGLSYI